MIHNLAAMTPRNKNLIINRIFLPGLLLLLVNDHFLKLYYPNWLTGKLSDFTGLLIFPLFLAYLFPRQARHWPLITGLFFIFWKSSWSTPFIALYNKFSPIGIARVVDYSDLIALSILPLSSYLIPRIDRYAIRSYTPPAFWLVAPCSLIFMATEPPYYYRSLNEPKGDIYVHKTYHSRLTPQQVLDTLAKKGYAVRPDTGYHSRYSNGPFYIIENIPLPGPQDTLRSVQFELRDYNTGSALTVNNINLGKTVNLGNWKMLRRYTRWYKASVKKYIFTEVE
jgi:hypothetical protein